MRPATLQHAIMPLTLPLLPAGFYIWRHDAPHSLWASVGSGLLVLLVFMMTLFPVVSPACWLQ